MDLFFGTLIAIAVCALALALGMLLGGPPIERRCGRSGLGRLWCIGCPYRSRDGSCERAADDRENGP